MFALCAILSTLAFGQTLAGHLLVNHGVTIGITPYSQPIQTQYHSQDSLGQYVYGYATPESAKNEIKTADGITRGGYSYIDPQGLLQTVEYIVDPVNGLRVSASNIPQDLPEVAIAKAQHLSAFRQTQLEHAVIAAERQATHNAIVAKHAVAHAAVVGAVAGPAPVQDLPEVVKARAEHLAAVEATKARDAALQGHAILAISPVPVAGSYQAPVHVSHAVNVAPVAYASAAHLGSSSQYHAQDEYGQYTYGYAGPHSAKTETKSLDGVTRGGYSYIDANGILQTIHYISDSVNGFRVAATNLPIDPHNP